MSPLGLSLKEGDVIAGRYRITGTLGRGGFGAVYSAEHEMTGQALAIKVLAVDPKSSTDDVEARFFREARITARLTDLHTVRVFDVGKAADGALFMAMEMLRGPTLEAVLKRLTDANKTMADDQAIDTALPILQSLAEAHKAGLVHRDLKPANIMLATKGDDHTVVKVLDFGIARTTDSDLTADGTALGTPAYMSPEQVMGQDLDGRSDLYALSLILYRAVVGELPFKHRDPYALAFMRCNTNPTPAAGQERTTVSEALSAVIMRGLARDPADRFADANAMRDALVDVRYSSAQGLPKGMPDKKKDPKLASTQRSKALDGLRNHTTPIGDALAELMQDIKDESTATPSAVRNALAKDGDGTLIGTGLADGGGDATKVAHVRSAIRTTGGEDAQSADTLAVDLVAIDGGAAALAQADTIDPEEPVPLPTPDADATVALDGAVSPQLMALVADSSDKTIALPSGSSGTFAAATAMGAGGGGADAGGAPDGTDAGSSKRGLFIGIGAGVIAAIISAIAIGGGDKDVETSAASAEVESPAKESAKPAPTADSGIPAAAPAANAPVVAPNPAPVGQDAGGTGGDAASDSPDSAGASKEAVVKPAEPTPAPQPAAKPAPSSGKKPRVARKRSRARKRPAKPARRKKPPKPAPSSDDGTIDL